MVNIIDDKFILNPLSMTIC